ncbi:MAG TPA: HAMP domain-containing protein [Desulfuromonadales bacterium]|nr:HAMP domain-containing protein [Desulfuromonadales bacterium]
MYRPTLTVSIMAFLVFLLILTWLLFSLLTFKTAANDLYAQKGEHARTLLATFVSQLPDPLPVYPAGFIFSDLPAASYIQKLADDAMFTRLTLLDVNGKAIFSAGRETSDIYLPFSGLATSAQGSFITQDGSGVSHIMSVVRNGQIVGKAGLLLSLASEKSRLNKTRQMLVAYFVLDFILLLVLGSFVLSRIVVNPINQLLAATEKITGGNYGQQLHVSGSVELSRLAESFNMMSGSLLAKDQQVQEQMTELEKANRELQLAREEAIRTEKMASIGLLAAGMAHEIGTPLASIMGYAELTAAEEPANPVLQDYARRISEDCSRIDRIVRGLLDYSRPRTAGSATSDVQQLVADTVELLARQGACKGLQISQDVADRLPAVLADPHQLQQVLINLMLNARDAMPGGGALGIAVRPENGQVRIDIRDSGPGIPADDLKLIFDPFFTTKPPGKGTGLGLAISIRIVEGFGGRLAVESRAGEGSCFTLRLPTSPIPVESENA